MALENLKPELNRLDRVTYLKKIIKKDELIDKAKEEVYNDKKYSALAGFLTASSAIVAYILYNDNETGLAVMSGLNTLASFGLSGYLTNKIALKNKEIEELKQGKRRLENLL